MRLLRWPAVLVICAAMAVAAYLWTARGVRELAGGFGSKLEAVAGRLGRMGEGFRSATITQSFVAAIPRLETTGAGNLELATATVTELLSRAEEKRILWDWVSLGETVTEIRVPVTYRYHVRLADPWQLEVSGQTCVVRAPAIRASLPPAIHTDRLEKHTDAGWLQLDAARQMEELERSLTPTLSRYASDEVHLRLVREEARKTVAEFVRAWLLREDHWRSDRFHAIVVTFADEPSPAAEDRAPVLRLPE